MSIWSRIANVFRSDQLRKEIDDELESHIAEAMESGQSLPEARKAMGSVLQLREQSLDRKVIPWIESLRADIVLGCRRLLQSKITSLAAILSLALANRVGLAAG